MGLGGGCKKWRNRCGDDGSGPKANRGQRKSCNSARPPITRSTRRASIAAAASTSATATSADITGERSAAWLDPSPANRMKDGSHEGDLARSGSGGSASTFLTGGDAGLVVKKSEFCPPIHPKQRPSANNDTPAMIAMPCRVISGARATTTRSRFVDPNFPIPHKCSFRCSSLNLIGQRRQVRSRLIIRRRRGRPVVVLRGRFAISLR